MRIVIDTNLWISALISASTRGRLEFFLANAHFVILADSNLISELTEVAARPKFSRYVSADQIAVFLGILQERLYFIEANSIVQVCRDPNDDYLLAICKDGKADVLVTGDKDLLSLFKFEQTMILSLTGFEKLVIGA